MTTLTHDSGSIPVSTRTSDRGTVVGARDASVRAGLEMYELGGNAVDAAVSAALVAGVIEPTETTLAGSGFILIRLPNGEMVSVDAGPLAPLSAHAEMYELDKQAMSSNVLGLAPVVGNANVTGTRASGVPRILLALTEAHAKYGELPRSTVFAPAIRAATEGFTADSWFVVNALQDLTLLRSDPGCAETFLANGLPKGSASASPYGLSIESPHLITQPRLARTLEVVAAQGPEALTTGGIAEQLIKTFGQYGMTLGAADLLRAAPRIETPRMMQFRGATVAVPNAPGGGLSVLQALNVWQRLASDSAVLTRSDRVLLTSRVLRHVFADRYHWLADPERQPVPLEGLLSETYAAHLAEQCHCEPWNLDAVPMEPWTYFADVALHDPWPYEPGNPTGADRPRWGSAGATEPSSGTTHISAADRDGFAVSITHTAANHFGSAVLCPRTGLLFDSAMAWFNAKPGAANSITPGGRPVANMAPALLVQPDGTAVALGASGGRRIISAIFHLVRELVEGEGEHAPECALATPRIDASGSRVVLHERDADLVESLPEFNALVVPQQSLSFELDFARANLAATPLEGPVVSAIETRAYGL
ncbi:gamma-glutamyltransferase [Vreelandella glaciei]|uniref:gamma-glutamyltransferase n=1 Tax=Vreelandella glaciei TaxID=186761 RepID=UPI0030022DD3